MAAEKTVFGSISGAVDAISHCMGLVGGLLILVMALITGYEVLVRSVFNAPTTWVYDLTVYLFIGSSYLGLSFTEAMKGHVRVDLFVARLSARTQRLIQVIIGIIGIAYCTFFLWAAIWLVKTAIATDLHSGTLFNVPLAPVQVVIPIGFLALILQWIVNLIRKGGAPGGKISHEINVD